MKRTCGDCQICCKLLPVRAVGKGANERCRHQRFGKGCAIYHHPSFPVECRVWSCRWLADPEAHGLSRPDRAHYVVDIMPDFLTSQDNNTGETQKVAAIQVWVDPAHPDAHRDPALRDYLHARALEGYAAIIRYNARDGFTLFAPPMVDDGQWHEIPSKVEPTHTPGEIALAFRSAQAKGQLESPP